MAGLAVQLGLGDRADLVDPVASVHAMLASWPEPWLLIFDNVRDERSVRAVLPPAGQGRILITSQSALWPHGMVASVDVLPPEEAGAFLMTRTADDDPQAAGKLAEELGGLPLALEQAGAYIQAAGTDLKTYLELFERKRSEMLTRGDPLGYDKTIATAWSLAFARLQQHDPVATGLLRLIGCCAAEPIPLQMLLQSSGDGSPRHLPARIASSLRPLLDDPLASKDAVASLRRYSFINPVGNDTVIVHRLVQAVTRGHMPPNELADWTSVLAVLIERAVPADPSIPAEWPTCAQLLPHAYEALPPAAPVMSRLAQYLESSGNYSAARDLQARIVDALEGISGTALTLTARAGLARFSGEAGDPAAARDIFAQLVPDMQLALGRDHPDVLDARSNLAEWTGEAGGFSAARAMFADLQPDMERMLGRYHPDTLGARGNLAAWTGEAGDVEKARDLNSALLQDVDRALGPDHPHTLLTRGNLARFTCAGGDAALARNMAAALLPDMQRVFGPDHPYTLITRVNLARFTGDAGDPVAGRDMNAELLAEVERVLGRRDRETFAVRTRLARFTAEAGDPRSAKGMLISLVAECERVLGAGHAVTTEARHALTRLQRPAAPGA
jgi:hypothetical protein